MPAPHPLASLAAGGPGGLALARRALSAALRAHHGDVRAAAASLDPPIHETSLHRWLTAWGGPELAELCQGREAAGERSKAGAKKKSRARAIT